MLPRRPSPRDDAVVVIEADDPPDAPSSLDGDPSTAGLALRRATGAGAVNRAGVDPRFRGPAHRACAGRRPCAAALARDRRRDRPRGSSACSPCSAPLLRHRQGATWTVRVRRPGRAVQQVVDTLHGDLDLTADLDGAALAAGADPLGRSGAGDDALPQQGRRSRSPNAHTESPFLCWQPTRQFRVIDADALVVAVLPNQPTRLPADHGGVLPEHAAAGTGAGDSGRRVRTPADRRAAAGARRPAGVGRARRQRQPHAARSAASTVAPPLDHQVRRAERLPGQVDRACSNRMLASSRRATPDRSTSPTGDAITRMSDGEQPWRRRRCDQNRRKRLFHVRGWCTRRRVDHHGRTLADLTIECLPSRHAYAKRQWR